MTKFYYILTEFIFIFQVYQKLTVYSPWFYMTMYLQSMVISFWSNQGIGLQKSSSQNQLLIFECDFNVYLIDAVVWVCYLCISIKQIYNILPSNISLISSKCLATYLCKQEITFLLCRFPHDSYEGLDYMKLFKFVNWP